MMKLPMCLGQATDRPHRGVFKKSLVVGLIELTPSHALSILGGGGHSRGRGDGPRASEVEETDVLSQRCDDKTGPCARGSTQDAGAEELAYRTMGGMKPFRFGVNVWRAGSRTEWADKARKLEDLGYSALTVPDHLTDLFAPMPALVSAAEATKSLRVGTNVLNNDFRHPVLVAREAATVDLLTDGRLQLGLGAGHMQSEYDQAGLRFDAGGTRVERLAEAVAIVKALLQGKQVTFAGRHYRVTGHTIHPLPVQRPHPPILVGGNGRQLLTLAAKEADIVGLTGFTLRRGGTEPDFSGFTAAGVDERVKLVRDAA